MAVSLPMMGSWNVRVHRVSPYSIHGDSYYEFVIERLGQPAGGPARGPAGEPSGNPPSLLALRTSAHVLPIVPPVPFDAEVTFLMSQITGVRVVNPTQP